MTRYEYTYNREAFLNIPYIQTPILQNREIIEVYIDGIGRSQIVDSSPAGQQVAYTPAIGRITFADVLPQFTQIVVLYQNI